ncbi:hypothetical protein ACX9YQ_11680 (plasmid) [Weissella cibaria]
MTQKVLPSNLLVAVSDNGASITSDGVRLSNQNGLGNNGKTEYFTLDGHYKVLERSGNAVKVQIDQEPVWLQASFSE